MFPTHSKPRPMTRPDKKENYMSNDPAAEFRQLFSEALSGSSTERVARRRGWRIDESVAQHGGNPAVDSGRVRQPAIDPSQGRGWDPRVPRNDREKFARMLYPVTWGKYDPPHVR